MARLPPAVVGTQWRWQGTAVQPGLRRKLRLHLQLERELGLQLGPQAGPCSARQQQTAPLSLTTSTQLGKPGPFGGRHTQCKMPFASAKCDHRRHIWTQSCPARASGMPRQSPPQRQHQPLHPHPAQRH